MDNSKIQSKVNKLEALRVNEGSTEGEKLAAEKGLKRLKDAYGLTPDSTIGEEENEYKVSELSPHEKYMLKMIIYKYDGVPFTWSGKGRINFKSVVNFHATPTNFNSIMEEFKRHRKPLNEVLEEMTKQYVIQNRTCLFREVTPEEWAYQEVSEIEKMMHSMNLKTHRENYIAKEVQQQIGEDDARR